MLNRLFKVTILMIALNVIQTTSAVFFTGEALQEKDINVVILGDVHADVDLTHKITQTQHNDLLDISKKYNAFLIVEDKLSMIESRGESFYSAEKLIPLYHIPGKNIRYDTPLSELCIKAKKVDLQNINIECRIGQTLLGTSIIDPKIINSIEQFENNEFQTYLKNLKNKRSLTSNDWLELNTVYEFGKALKKRNNKLFIIAIGATHIRNISEMIRSIFNFKITLQKNLTKNIDLFGSKEKNREMQEKEIIILNQYALNLPQFFQEAFQAPPIKSRL